MRDQHLKELPVSCVKNAHVNLQNCAIYIFMQFPAKRGKEGIEDSRLDMYKKTHTELLNLTAWVRQYAEQSKNHASDGEEIENAGMLPFLALTVRYEIY